MPEKPYHHGDLRRQLLEATRSLVERDGTGSVTLARVARGCGVSIAAPYRHFASKEALLAEVAAIGFEELSTALAAGATASDPAERLVAAGVAYVEFAVARPHLFRLMFDADVRERLPEAGPAALQRLTRLVEPLQTTVPTAVAVRTTWALAHGLAALRIGGMITFTAEDTETRLRDELRALLTGIAPSTGPTRLP